MLGIFNWDHMQYECDREVDQDSLEGEPSLTEMVEVAIKMLQKSDNGYFLMVEGGKIDKSQVPNYLSSSLFIFYLAMDEKRFERQRLILK